MSCLTDYAPPGGSYNYAYYLRHPWKYVAELYYQAKWFIQRGYRGYADCDVWSLDWHLSGYMGNALRDLAKHSHGTPIIDIGRELSDDPNDIDTFTMEEWKATILYIAETFDMARGMQDFYYKTPAEYEDAQKRVHHGLAMFNEYFFSLWD